MSEIIQKWLTTRLGVILDLNLLSFGNIAKDGCLIAQILYNYGILNTDDLDRVPKTDNFDYALRNLLFLNNFLKTLGLDYAKKKLESIARGDGMMALRLFYQLYLLLNNKNKLYFITNQVSKEKKETSAKSDILQSETATTEKSQTISKPDLESSAAVLKWHKNNYLEQFFKCKEIREKYLIEFGNSIKNRHVSIIESRESDKELKTETTITTNYDSDSELNITFRNQIKKFAIPNINCENISQAKEYVSSLKKKTRKFIEEKKLQTFIHKLFINNLLEKLLENQRIEFNNAISKKLLKQSYYEKQMETKLLEVRRQKDNMVHNRILENEFLMKKKDEKFVAQLYQHRHNVCLANLRNDNERKRILELHKKIYEEKHERKFKKHWSMCTDIVNDLFTLTMKTLDYKTEYNVNVPPSLWTDWMALFYAEQDLNDPTENIKGMLDEENENDIFTTERYKQNRLDEKDMTDYLCSEWPWNLDEMANLYTDSYRFIKLGENVLGFIVHRLLKAKYPLPLPPHTPVLPKVLTAASVVGCTDETLSGVLETILKRKNILVINMQSAINFCLKAFLKETPKELEVKPEGTHEKGNKHDKNEKQDLKKGEKSKGPQKGKAEATPSKEPQMKETQTPNVFPGEEHELSPQAILGQFAYETLNMGLPLNERLVANMFVEYLKSLKGLRGWVLMNYPENLKAAITLEYALTGQPLEYEIDDNESGGEEEYTLTDYLRDELFVELDDENGDKRFSKLLPNPQPVNQVKQKSYLNSFIYLMKKTEPVNPEIENADYVQHFMALKKLYDQLGCNNSVKYLSLDPDTINEIILMITKDGIFAAEIYDQIIKIVFEITERNKKKREEQEARKGKEPGGAGKGKDKGDGKKHSHAEPAKETETKPSHPPEPEIIETPPEPGEPKWIYTNLPLPPETQVVLASFWEDVEEIYLNDFKQVFFLKRICHNSIVPYVHKIYTHMIDYIERPDKKQEYLYKFQLTYNEIENDLREDDEFKAEMHCRIAEFKSKLWDICVSKMRDSETERIRIINENWFHEHVATFISIFNAAIQLELDRSANIYFLLQDYYYSMTPLGLTENKYTKFVVKNFPILPQDSQFLIKVYSDVSCTVDNNPFVAFLSTMLQETLAATNAWYTLATVNCKKIQAMIGGGKPKDKKQPLSDKATPLSDFERSAQAMYDEWLCAIEGENLRIKYRLNLINAKAKYDIFELLLYGEKLFHDLYAQLDKRYHDELHSVNAVCDIFSKAVEACESIQPRLILQGSGFYVGSNELLFDDPLEIPQLFKEEITNTYFTIAQLSKLVDMFFDLAPRDSIPTKAFTYILEDMVVHIPENSEDSLLPYHWHLLQPSKVQELVFNIFGNVEFVGWRDFIIYNLEVPFPTEMELLCTRHEFREMDPDKLEFVNEIQFNLVQFWFEKEEHMLQYPIKKDLIKKLLAKMFKINDRINYSSLLLSFCKDKDPIIGVAKGFGLSMGKLVCYDEEVGKNYIEILAYQKYLKKQARLEALQTAEDIYSEIIKTTVPSSEGSEVIYPTKASSILQKSVGEQSVDGEIGSCIFEDMLEEEYIQPYMPELCYVLPFNVVLVILTAALPWHCRVQCIQDNGLRETLEMIYESCRNEEHDCVFSHEFLNSTVFQNYLNQNLKFVALSPAEMIQAEIDICKCVKDKDRYSISIN